MSQNFGIAPLDPTSDVGRVRLLVGDTDYEEIGGRPGWGDYANFSDVEIELAIEEAGPRGNKWAVAWLFIRLAMAQDPAAELTQMKSDDLSLTIGSRSGGFWNTARFWLDLWQAEEDAKTVEFHNFVKVGPERIVEPELNHWGRVRPGRGGGAAIW